MPLAMYKGGMNKEDREGMNQVTDESVELTIKESNLICKSIMVGIVKMHGGIQVRGESVMAREVSSSIHTQVGNAVSPVLCIVSFSLQVLQQFSVLFYSLVQKRDGFLTKVSFAE